MPNRIDRFFRLFSYAAVFAAVVFFVPGNAQAFSIPQDVTLQTDAFVQVMDRDEVRSWYAQNKHFTFRSDEVREFEDILPACVTFRIFCQGFLSRLTQEHIVLSHTFTLVPETIRSSIEQFADKVNRDPKNARLTVQDTKVSIAIPAENGITVDVESSFVALESALRTAQTPEITVPLSSIVTPAKVSAETLSSLGITERIGTATTNFRGSPKNRIYNINRAIQDFDGIVIDSGATFSFVDYLG
ncbi:MAG: peptidoglycan binding domain-containing protein, partial [Candidatus Moraniibacteriota bacterium]